MDAEQLYDVVGVRIADSTVRFMAQGETKRNAEAIVRMAVMRRGVEEEFFAEVPAGRYSEGDKFTGMD